MKKSILILATAFTFSAFFTSCREVNEEKNEIEVKDDMDDVDDMDDLDEVEEDVERAADDAGNAVERAAEDVEDEIEGNDDQQ